MTFPTVLACARVRIEHSLSLADIDLRQQNANDTPRMRIVRIYRLINGYIMSMQACGSSDGLFVDQRTDRGRRHEWGNGRYQTFLVIFTVSSAKPSQP